MSSDAIIGHNCSGKWCRLIVNIHLFNRRRGVGGSCDDHDDDDTICELCKGNYMLCNLTWHWGQTTITEILLFHLTMTDREYQKRATRLYRENRLLLWIVICLFSTFDKKLLFKIWITYKNDFSNLLSIYRKFPFYWFKIMPVSVCLSVIATDLWLYAKVDGHPSTTAKSIN